MIECRMVARGLGDYVIHTRGLSHHPGRTEAPVPQLLLGPGPLSAGKVEQCLWNSCSAAADPRGTRNAPQADESMDDITAVTDEVRGIVEPNWPHLSKLPPKDE
jgi:hypothetical protein